MNSIKLKGTLGSDPKFKFFNSGAGICEFSIAEYNGKYKASDKIPTGKAVGDKKTLWHNIKMWAKDIDPQIVKGVEVEITGRLDVEIFTNKDGVEVNKPVIYIDVDSITGIQSIKISEWYATKKWY
jgi:single stranded DNA-binding protein